MLSMSAWWQLLMEMLQMRPSNEYESFLTTLSSVSQQEGAKKWKFFKLGTD